MAEARVIGLDVGSLSVRAAEVSIHDGAPTLHNVGQVKLPPGAMVSGLVTEPAVVTLAIERLWKERKFSGRDVVLGVANSQVVVRAIDLPWVAPEHLQKSLPYLVRDVLPIPVEDAILDFVPFGTPAQGEQIRGLLVASPRENVTTLVRCVERAGLRPVGVDLASFALLRSIARGSAAQLVGGESGDRRKPRPVTEALVDIGATVTNIVLHQGGVPQVVRIVPSGSADVTAALADRLGIPLAEAEELKLREGVGEVGSKVATLARLAISPLLQQLRGSLDYFSASHAGARVDRVLLCGGGARMRGFVQVVREELGLEAQLVDAVADLDVRSRHIDADQLDLFRPHAAVPIGLAL